jgi:mono/diheme cytochrome c family protein
MRAVLKFAVPPLIIAGGIIGFGSAGLAQESSSGKADYEASCAACHGSEGKGDGPRSGELRAKPPNLTILARRNDGVFPSEVLYQIIDGRKTLRAHGTFEMPVWGNTFQATGSGSGPEHRIRALIGYLKSIQVE